ncbi:MAG: phage major capsid protein [Planctomycetaceae bacterium]|nr:phage major capsid protein [Planctomycetaceae bacterium]
MNEEQVKALIKGIIDEHQKGLLKNDEFVGKLAEAVKTVIKSSLDDMSTMKKNIEALTTEIKSLRAGSLADGNVKLLDPLYAASGGCWKSAEMARDFGLYCLAAICKSKRATDLLKAKGYTLEEKAMTENDPTSAGLLVPQQILDGLIMMIGQYGKFRRDALVQPMASDSAMGFRLDSGLTVYCVQEGTTPNESKPILGTIGLSAKEWLTYTLVDKSLNEDCAIALGNLLGELIALAFAEKEDFIGFMGDGNSTSFNYIGIVGQFNKMVAAGVTPKGLRGGSGSGWAGLVLGDFSALQGDVHDKAEIGEGPKWYCSKQFYHQVMRKLALSAGGVNAQEVQAGSVNKIKMFLAAPVEFVQSMPTATGTSQICCFYGNLKVGAILGDRRQMTISQSEHYKFAERQLTVLGSERVAICVYGCGDGDKAGTIVALKSGA